MAEAAPTAELLSIGHAELLEAIAADSPAQRRDAVHSTIAAALGPGGLGALAVTAVPGVAEARGALLPLGDGLASLPPAVLAELEDPAATFNVGWSHGREQLQDGRPDTAKGSFFANPQHDSPTADAALIVRPPLSRCPRSPIP